MNAIEPEKPQAVKACCNVSFGAGPMLSQLGPLSSHPAHTPLRLLAWSAVALAPLLAGLLVLALWLKDGSIDPTRFLINHVRVIALYGLSSAGFATGFGLTAFAATVASRSRMLAADKDVKRGPVLAVIAMLFLLGIATWGIPLITNASSETRLLMAWLGLLPVMLLMSLSTFLPHEDSAGKLVSHPSRLWALVFPAAVIAFVVATRLKSVSDWLQQVSVIQTPLKVLIEAADASGLQPSAIESMKSWFLTGIIAVIACPLLSLALAAVNLMGRGVRAVISSDGHAPAETGLWRDSLLSSLGVAPGGNEAYETSLSDATYAAADDPSTNFFAESPITMDQAAAFHQIVSVAEGSIACPLGTHTNPCPSGDFILEGPPGSGRTATVLAALIQGAVVTGDMAIVLVAQESKRETVTARLRLATRSLGVDGFIGIGHLTQEAVSRWADPNGHESGERVSAGDLAYSPNTFAETTAIPPRILVGTLLGLEQAFFSCAYGFDSLKRVIGHINTVAIDDLDGFGMPDRLHLPYVLAKLRLIRASDGHSLRTLLVTKPIADAARQLIARQLMRSVSIDKHWMRLARIPLPSGATVSTATLPPGENDVTAIDLLVTCGKACRAQELNVAIVVPFATPSTLSEIRSRCQRSSKSDRQHLLFVVGDIDAIPTLGSPDHALLASVTFDSCDRNDGAAFVVAWKSGEPAAAVFTLPGDARRSDAAKHALMVLPGKESDSLFAQHFASAARFIPRLQLIPRTVFTATGLPAAGMLRPRLAQYRKRTEDTNALVDRVLLLDPSDATTEHGSNDPVLWPACAISDFADGGPPAPRHVAIRGVLPASMWLTSDPSADAVTVFERASTRMNPQIAQNSRTVIWRAPDGSELARDDLAYLNSFCLESEQRLFSPTRIQVGPSGVVVIDVRALSNRQGMRQPAMPAFEIDELAMVPGIQLRRLLQSAPIAHRVAIFGVVPQSQQESVTAMNSAAPQTATLRMIGLYDSTAHLREWELCTSYEAAKFFVLFDPPADMQSAEALNEHLLVNWGARKPETHEDFPELAAAITEAMRWQAPGLERLVRCLGFRIHRHNAPPLVGLVFIEPRSTESSGFAIMEPIVYDLEVMHEFFDRAAGILEQAARHEDSAAVLYGRAGIAMNARIRNGRLTVQPDAVNDAATLLRSIATEAALPA